MYILWALAYWMTDTHTRANERRSWSHTAAWMWQTRLIGVKWANEQPQQLAFIDRPAGGGRMESVHPSVRRYRVHQTYVHSGYSSEIIPIQIQIIHFHAATPRSRMTRDSFLAPDHFLLLIMIASCRWTELAFNKGEIERKGFGQLWGRRISWCGPKSISSSIADPESGWQNSDSSENRFGFNEAFSVCGQLNIPCDFINTTIRECQCFTAAAPLTMQWSVLWIRCVKNPASSTWEWMGGCCGSKDRRNYRNQLPLRTRSSATGRRLLTQSNKPPQSTAHPQPL